MISGPARFIVVATAAMQLALPAPVVPSGTVLHVRLARAISSQTARRGDTVAATLIVPVRVEDRVIPAGVDVLGTVDAVTAHSIDHQAQLRLNFDRLGRGTASIHISAVVDAVDNARETVAHDGTIRGPATQIDRTWGRLELLSLAVFVPELFAIDAAGARIREGVHVDVAYGSGVDLDLRLTTSAAVSADILEQPSPIAAIPSSLIAQIRALPVRTAAGRPPRPADVVNIAFLGSRSRLDAAFQRAGWNTADALSVRADIKTFLALAAREGYRLGPVSMQTLDDRAPDAVFQKQTNTFAKRHHVRIWRYGEWNGRDLWAAAATHDVGVEFAASEHTFTHRVDGPIDLERDKIVNDLAFVGVPRGGYVERVAGPETTKNAAGDTVVTDGRVALIDVGAP